MSTLTYTGQLVVTSCWCGIHLAIPSGLYEEARRVEHGIYCPLGHTFVFGNTTEKENARLRSALADAQTRVAHARDEAEFQRRRVIAYRGVLGKTKKRIAAGVCPCCTRTFQNLARHMAAQHPDYSASGEPPSPS
jgi:hypothetical protein